LGAKCRLKMKIKKLRNLLKIHYIGYKSESAGGSLPAPAGPAGLEFCRSPVKENAYDRF